MTQLLNFNKTVMKKFIRSSKIPIDVNTPRQMTKDWHEQWLEALGFTISGEFSGCFQTTFPKGWRKVNILNIHNMCYLVDENKSKRAALFYEEIPGKTGEPRKVRTYVNYMTRFHFYSRPVDSMSLSDVQIMLKDEVDGDKVVQTIHGLSLSAEKSARTKKLSEIMDRLEVKLAEQLPGWDEIDKYWNEPVCVNIEALLEEDVEAEEKAE